jgi:phage-related protein
MPKCKPLENGVWELRTDLGNRSARVLFCFHDGALVALSGFIKKTQKTPKSELELAERRMKEVKSWRQKS